MKTVIEFHEFIRKAEKEFSEEEREEIVYFLSKSPKAGKILENFGGISKLEWKKNEKNYNVFFIPAQKIFRL